jgi:hypothetical protein
MIDLLLFNANFSSISAMSLQLNNNKSIIYMILCLDIAEILLKLALNNNKSMIYMILCLDIAEILLKLALNNKA